MNVLIIGASVFIESYLTENLLNEGLKIIDLDKLQRFHSTCITDRRQALLLDL